MPLPIVPPAAPASILRRRLLIASGAATLALPALAQPRTVLPAMTEGPFYPSAEWRRPETDWDADLTSTRRGGHTRTARGEHLALALKVADANGRLIDLAEVEIWQCDALLTYRHPSFDGADDKLDPGFQGFGEARSDARGELGFRTIRPLAYPGRCPHIHAKLRHASFGELSSQLFVEGDPGNARDFLFRRLSAAGQAATSMRLESAGGAGALRWRTRHWLIVPA